MSGGAQLGLGFIEEPHGVSSLAALEQQPAFMDVGHSHQSRGVHLKRERFCLLNMMEGKFVLAALAMGAALPKVGDDDEMGLKDARTHAQDEVEDLTGFNRVFLKEGNVCLYHPKAQIVSQLHSREGKAGEWRSQFGQVVHIFVAEIDPLSDAEKPCPRTRLGGMQDTKPRSLAVEERKAVAHLPADEGFVEIS
jgi:hypothetical protein